MHRANCIVSDEKEREEEIDHVKAALTMNDYPAWMLVKENGERKKNLGETQGRDEAILTSGKRRIPVEIPYIRQSSFGGCTRIITFLHTTSLLTHCANSWFDQKFRSPTKEWWAQSIMCPVKTVGRTI